MRFNSRPGTPVLAAAKSPSIHQTASTPNLVLSSDDEGSEKATREQEHQAAQEESQKRLQQLKEALEKEQNARTALEAELESLSQALFEEVCPSTHSVLTILMPLTGK